MTTKVCRKCCVEQPLERFVKAAGCKDGHSWTCLACTNKINRERLAPLHADRPRIEAAALLAEGKKKCTRCGIVKLVAEFHRGAAVRWGKHGIAARCKVCASELNQAYRKSHRERLEEYNKKYREREDIAARRTTTRRKRSHDNPRYVMQITLRHGLNRKPTEFPATVDDLMEKFAAQNGCCAVSGIRLTWSQGKVLATSISLDRIDPTGGYSSDNLRLVCQAVNAFKGRMSDSEMLDMARAIVAHAEVKPEPFPVHAYLSLAG